MSYTRSYRTVAPLCRLGLVLLVIGLGRSPVIAEDPVSFHDPNLQIAVEETLWTPDPTPADMATLTKLEWIEGGPQRLRISDLTGLEYAVNLEELNLRMNLISDLAPLSGLRNLQDINLSQNQISDVSALSGMVDLRTLDLHGNPLADLSPLSGLRLLESLTLRWDLVADVSPLGSLTSLTSLNLQDNRVSDLSALSSLSQLTSLQLSGNPIRDLSGLLGLRNLGSLDLLVVYGLEQEAYCTQLKTIAENNPYISLHYEPNPTPMMGVSASKGVYRDRIRVTWDPVCNGPMYTSYYQVYRSASADGLDRRHVSPWQTSSWFDDRTAEPGKTYSYWVRRSTSGLGLDAGYDSWPDRGWRSGGRTLYVDSTRPSDPNEDGSPGHPFDQVQEAIEAAPEGSRLVIAPGTYVGPLNLAGKSIELTGLDPNDPNCWSWPVIDAGGAGPVIRFNGGEDASALLKGLVLTGGRGDKAGAIHCSGGGLSVSNCLIVGNQATDPSGGAVYGLDSHITIINCTIADNEGGVHGGGVYVVDSHVVLLNSIVWGNLPHSIVVGAGPDPQVSFTDVRGSWPGEGNLDTDPLFALQGRRADVSAPRVPGDYHLKSQVGRWDAGVLGWVLDSMTSPCIDAGDPASEWSAEPWPHGDRINMGVYGGSSQASRSMAPQGIAQTDPGIPLDPLQTGPEDRRTSEPVAERLPRHGQDLG